MYLFDTDVLSRVIKAAPPKPLVERLLNLPRGLQFTTSINAAEIFYGASRIVRRDDFIRAFEDLVLSRLTVLPFDLGSARVFGRLKASLEKRGLSRSEPDLRIAAIALQHRLTVVTGNVRHFSGLPGLAVENWLE
ncbi:MAG: type II toxin-antitoxin system VapC family toxin [Candidatus Aminicenantes bacterium]|nr:type II toxin-antitoxin system VapC family toxin [Candidatus Aminicenantes bacterium]